MHLTTSCMHHARAAELRDVRVSRLPADQLCGSDTIPMVAEALDVIGQIHRTTAPLRSYHEVHGPDEDWWCRIAEDRDGFLRLGLSHACLGNPRIDLGLFLPGLSAEGGPPSDEVMPDAPDVAALGLRLPGPPCGEIPYPDGSWCAPDATAAS